MDIAIKKAKTKDKPYKLSESSGFVISFTVLKESFQLDLVGQPWGS
jgi:hypothetical protein